MAKAKKNNSSQPAKPVKVTVVEKVVPTSTRKRAARQGVPAWLRSVVDPFGSPPTSIPDEVSTPSVKYRSFADFVVISRDIVNPETTTGPTGILVGIFAHPQVAGSSDTASNCNAVIASLPYDSASDGYASPSGVPVTTVLRSVPNNTSMFPIALASGVEYGSYQYRCTAAEVTCTYNGTELQRSGTVTACLGNPTRVTAIPTSQNNNPINFVFGGNSNQWNAPVSISFNELMNRTTRHRIVRNPDETVKLTWIPNGTPGYSRLQSASYSLHSYDADVTDDQYFRQPVMLFAIDGVTGEQEFRFKCIWHWEVIPPTTRILCVPPTPSPYNVRHLERCINAFQAMCAVEVEDMATRGDGVGTVPVSSVGGSASNSSPISYIMDVVGKTQEMAQTPLGQELQRQMTGYIVNQLRMQRTGRHRALMF